MDDLSKRYHWYPPITAADEAWGLYILGIGAGNQRPRTKSEGSESGRPHTKSIGRVRPDRTRVLRDFHLVFLARGHGRFICDGKREMAVNAGDLIVLFPGLWHRYVFDPDSDWQEYWVLYNGSIAQRLRDKGFLDPAQPVLHMPDPAAAAGQFDAMFARLRRGEHSAAAGELMVLLGLATGQCRGAQPRQGDHVTEVLEAALEQLGEAGHQDADMRAIADAASMSYAHFRRVFKTRLGISPHQYHLQMLINRAKGLLGEGLHVGEVSAELGFDDTYYFSRLFKQKTGLAPSEWVGP